MADARRAPKVVRYRVSGIRRASCSATIKAVAKQHRDVKDARVSIASEVLTLEVVNGGKTIRQVTGALERLGYALTPFSGDTAKRRFVPGYRRGLWIFVILNIGYGIIEMIGGVMVGSHALQADALDFIGDGLITLLGLVAVRWSATLRARSALVQGYVLGLLAIVMLATTLYHFFEVHTPQPDLMVAFAVIALLVDVAAALVLRPSHKPQGGWRVAMLMSLQDALGSIDVILAALLVVWFESPWPDLITATILLSVFLYSARAIILDARADLKTDGER